MQKYYNKKRKLNKLKASLLLLMMVCFAGVAQAQTNVYMHSGTQNVTGTLNFYDSGGASSVNGSYYWEKWYQHNENATITFKNGDSPIQVSFGKFHAWGDSADGNSVVDLGEFSLRINNDHLYVYDGENADDSKLICDLTGTLTESFTISANGPITFKFVSDGQYRDEGWAATVTSPSTYTVQQPIITKETCSDYVILYNTAYGATVYYSTDNNDPDPFDPLSDATVYTAPFAIDLDAATASVLVRAIAVANGTHSAVASHTFTHSDQRPTPGAPQINIDGNTVTFVPAPVPAGLNETYNIRYTTNGTEPSATNGTLLTKSTGFSINWTTPNTTFKAVTVAVTCSSKVSAVTTEQFGNVTVPTPTITFDSEGKATITCSLDGATIYYTTDGTQPTTSSDHGTTPVTTEALAIGTTVYAYAVFSAEGYDDSSVGSAIYVPESGSGTYGGVVFLDDREKHTLSYYTEDSPIHSLNPRDIKITYFGNSPAGRTTMTTASENGNAPTTFSATASGVKVGIASTETQDQFIYLKTLEAANEDGSGNYPYTMIPNPFQVRPTGQSGTVTPETRDIYITYYRASWYNGGELEVTYIDANNQQQTEPFTINSSSETHVTITVKATTSVTFRLRGTGNSPRVAFDAQYDDANGTTFASSGNNWYTSTSWTSYGPYTIPTGSSITVSGWRGFYAWRVKSLSSGLTIQRANGSAVNVNGIIDPEEEIKFVTDKEEGNEVEFEALWAQAYVTTTGSLSNYVPASVKSARERNFFVLDGTGWSINGVTIPATYTAYLPDGTGGSASSSITTAITCSSDVRIENIIVSFTGTLQAAGYNLHIGRGVTGTVGTVYGSNTNSNINQTLRIEAGTHTNLYGMGSNGPGNNMTKQHIILGCDYDRAKSDDNKLSITDQIKLIESGSKTVGTDKVIIIVKSGVFQNNTGSGTAEKSDNCFYLWSPSTNNTGTGTRTMIVEGGQLWHIAGGLDCGNSDNTRNLTIRIKGGTIRGSIFAGAARYDTKGYKYIILTGGTVRGWIAGGSNGYLAEGTYGQGNEHGTVTGRSYIYVGGNTHVGGREDAINVSIGGYVYGAGCGNTRTTTNAGSVTEQTNVVIADEAYVKHAVYGGGAYGSSLGTANVYVLGNAIIDGDDDDDQEVIGGVFGGARQKGGGTVNITMNGGTINKRGLYGGSNAEGDISGLATINMNGGTTPNVFGGGYGSSTDMNAGTKVTVSGGTVSNNVYGGGEEGTVTGNTEVTFSGGTVNDIYGAGKGNATSTPVQRANITGSTTVAVSGGTVSGSVYGGGENGTVAYNQNGNNNTNYKSTVNVSGGEVKGDVYGGGKMGTSQVATTVNISDGIIRGHVFGGAFGEQQKVFVTGLRTVNMTGGHVYGNVYGGSRNANDGNNTTLANTAFPTSNTTTTMCVTNISGGVIEENVYAAGYFGNCFGSVYAFIGKDAIENAPYKQPTTGIEYKIATLSIGGTVWAGGDWGTFSGNFGGNTISGNSNIYVDGNGYETTTQQANNAQYMNIGGSILGCGTSCHAGKAERTVIVRNYGTAQGAQPTEASRTLYSIQFAKVLILDNSNINFTGQGRVNNLNQTEKYSIYEIYNDAKTTPNADTDVDGVRIVNGTGIFLNAPVTQIANFRSMSCDNTFASTTPTLTGYTLITPETLSSCNNQVRVNGGNYVEIKWGSNYGALLGYAHMMASNNDADATCAYARPRWCTGAAFDQNGSTDNPNDGGWISYTASENTFALNGAAGNVQMPYENHTVSKNGEQYFRIWRQGGTEHYREGIFNAHASGSDAWKTVDVVITLPAFRDPANYYCFETNGDATTIDYGADVLMWNAARETGTGNDWMYFNESTDVQMTGQPQSAVESTLTEMKKNADVNFGLVMLPSTGMAGSNYIICYEADNNLALPTTKYTKADNTKEPQVTFRLTYYDKLTSNMTWDPSSIVLVQKDASGKVVDRVTISLAVSTSSTIEQTFTTQLYAIMQGKGSTSETFNAKVVLPTFAANLYQSGVAANFTLNSVDFEPANGGVLIARGGTYNWNQYAVGYAAGLNYDNTDGWNGEGNYTERDSYPLTQNNPNAATLIGKTGGRSEFAIDFTLHYDGSQTATTEELIGTLTFNITFDNYKNAQGNLVNNQPLTIIVEVYRRGQGTRFYIDGINGSNANKGRHPDKAVKQLSTIFNRCGYMAGDEIYIVNQVTASKQLDWNGLPYSNVIIYRYNGGHELSATDASIVGNPNNTAYLGTLLNVTKRMTMEGITLDGYYNNGVTGTDDNGGPHTVTASASMITIANGGTLELSNGTVLFNNNSSSVSGSAVNVANGGKLMMNQDATIKNNVTTGDGGGVYMAGTIVVSDNIQIINNLKSGEQNNVFLTAADKMITIGTAAGNDAYGPLSADAKIGVTKSLTADIDNTYTRVVNVDQDVEWLETPFNTHPNSIIYHDGQKYQLVKYTDPKILYWLGTWVTLQDHVPTTAEGGWTWNGTDNTINIETQYQYAWVISIVNGENGQTGNSLEGKTVNILADLDMDESIWVPIGDDRHPFKGTINGNGHLIENMHSPLVQNYMGMIGKADGATIQDVMAKVNFNSNAANMGAVVGDMTTTTISNVEAAGIVEGGSNTVNLGGIAGNVVSGTIHSSFAVCDLTGTTETVMGGLVGTNGGNLYNSYANVNMEGSNTMGGLVGENKGGCHVENCYVNLGQMEIPAFAYTNHGEIKYCYASKAGQYVAPESEVADNVAPTLSGIFAAVKDRKHLDYMYRDNIVTAPEANTYANHEGIEYTNNTHAPLVWNGLLSVLNEWVDKTEVEGDFSSWYRPTTNTINGDLPVLAFPKDNCLGNFAEEDGKFLRYSAYDLTAGTSFNNGLDDLFTYYSGKAANIFLYNNATDVANGSGNANLFINEDAVLLQSGSNDITATVGVTFDNSCKKAVDHLWNTLEYDWHFMSTPLSNALIGATYKDEDSHGFGSGVDITKMENGYFPNGLPVTTPGGENDVKWDLYTYYEPEYHWINLKRNKNNHYHYDLDNPKIEYNEADQANGAQSVFTPGKGYMMAISQDSYMNSTGKLNKGSEKVTLYNKEELTPVYNKGWNLVGNPYQAYLDLSQITGRGDFYIYDADQGVFAPVTDGQSSNPCIPSLLIHPHQGFFMHIKNSDDESELFTFNYEWATAEKDENGASYFRGSEGRIDYPLVNIFAENEHGNRDLAVVEFNRPELGGATKVNCVRNTNFQLAASLEGERYGLVFTPEGTERVPVHFTTEEDGTFTLTWNTHNGEFTSLLLVDNMTGTITDMLHTDHYTFDATTDDYASRFYITYRVTAVDENVDGDGTFAFFDGSAWIVEGKGMLDVVDVQGRTLFSERLVNDKNRVSLNGVAAGVYLLRVSDGNDTMVQKIVVR